MRFVGMRWEGWGGDVVIVVFVYFGMLGGGEG